MNLGKKKKTSPTIKNRQLSRKGIFDSDRPKFTIRADWNHVKKVLKEIDQKPIEY